MRIMIIAVTGGVDGHHVVDVDGFSARCAAVVSHLRRHHSTSVTVLAKDASGVPLWVDPMVDQIISFSRGTGNRRARLKRLYRLVTRAASDIGEKELHDDMRNTRADVYIFLTPRQPDLVRLAPPRAKVVLFAEEFIPEGPDNWGYLGGLAGAVESAAFRFSTRRVERVAVISQSEVEYAKRTFGRDVTVVPHSLDERFWTPVARRTTNGLVHTVFTVGNYGSVRNAGALRMLIDELHSYGTNGNWGKWTLEVASGTGYHDDLLAVAKLSQHVTLLGEVPDVRTMYGYAFASLVPSRKVQGVKTTILQSWLQRCPVVASREAAASVAGQDGVDLLVGDTPSELIEHLDRLADNPDLSSSLIAGGLASYHERFGHRIVAESIEHLLRSQGPTG